MFFINALSSSESMTCSYPPTKNPSKQMKQGLLYCKPITRNKPTPSSRYFLRSSSPSLRLGRRRRHCGSLHSRKEVVAEMVKGKSKDGGNDGRTDWKEPAELKAFCDLCAVQVLEGRRSGGFLKKEGVDAVIKKLGELGKVVTHTQFKNKWDHLRKRWKDYNDCFERESGLGRDPGTGKLDATDEWWTRKIAECPKAGTFKKKGLPNKDSMDIMFGGTVATGKNAFCPSGQIPKESTEGSGDSADSKEFVDPQCQPSVTVDVMDVDGPSLSRAGPADKGKGFASGVHLFRPIGKKPRRKHSFAQDMSESLKSISNVIVESRSIGNRTPCASKTTVDLKSIMDIVLTLPGVQSGDRLYMFSSLYFMEKEQGRSMFAALVDDKDVRLKWLEMQYQRHPEFHYSG